MLRVTTLKSLALILLAIACVVVIPACSDQPQWLYVDKPQLDSKSIKLKVAYVENERFAGLSQQQIQNILERSRKYVKQYLQIDIEYDEVVNIDIESFFNNLVHAVKQDRASSMLVPGKVSENDKLRLRNSIYETLENYWNDREMVTDFARPYLVNGLEQDDFHKLADALVDTLLQRLSYWFDQKSDDGNPVLDDAPYNEWVWWDSLGYGNVPYDVVITNQLVASAEYYGMDVHSSLRGGISAGTTTFSKTAQFKSFSWIMLYPMLNDNEVLTTLRDDKHYSEQQITDYAAALLTHELGHLLLHLGHPFGNHNCIMSPTPLLMYRKWLDELDADLCALGSEEQMTAGSAKIEYRADW